MSDPPITLSDIPTLSILYSESHLHPPKTLSSHTPSHSLNSKISLIRTDITTLSLDAIVNAANTSLLGGGGVDGAIHSAAGPRLLSHCRTLSGCPTGSAVLTPAFSLPSRHVIHAVGPIYSRALRTSTSAPADLLRGCYLKSLELAREKGCRSLAFSCLSTGVYGYPSMDAAEVATREVRRFLEEEGEGVLERVVFCCFEGKDLRAYEKWLPKIFPPTKEELAGTDWESPEPQPTNPQSTPHDPKRRNPSPADPTLPSPDSPLPVLESADLDQEWERIDPPSPAPVKTTPSHSESGHEDASTKNGLLKDW